MVDYRTYITSAEWKQNPARLAELEQARGLCRICGARARLQVHHSSYRQLGAETTGQFLVALCPPCHSVADRLRRARTGKGFQFTHGPPSYRVSFPPIPDPMVRHGWA